MNDTKVLIEKIKEGIQEKKGKKIVVADLTSIEDTICKYFVICQGNSPSQVSAIVDSIKEFTRKGADSKPYAIGPRFRHARRGRIRRRLEQRPGLDGQRHGPDEHRRMA